jgi:pyridoxamine 5'-phosphate oxidase
MSDRDGIFAGSDPFEISKAWLQEATVFEPNDANAIALASVDEAGLPNVRIVLLKDIEADAFIFYTNYQSAKGRELIGSGQAAFVMHWKSLRRQIRVRGQIEKEDGAVSDAYYKSRPLGSKIGAWASQQSAPLKARQILKDQVDKANLEHGENPERPPHWGGFRLYPLEIEFWSDGEFRLHDRFVWRRRTLQSPWDVERISP